MAGDISDVKARLAGQALAVAEMLLPAGRKEGAEWRAGSIAGEVGKSLGVNISGRKAGVWMDFDTGEGGDLLDLWCKVKGIDITAALAAARAWLGIERPKPLRTPKRAYTRPEKPSCTKPQGLVLDYLREDRNIPVEVMERYKIGAYGDFIVFPFLDPAGELIMCKVREAKDGAAPRPIAADCEPILFGWQTLPANAREVVICEGEIDALSWAAYGRFALSVPFGGGAGGKQRWIESEYDRLDRFERIFISTDHDKPGDEAAVEIASRLGRHRCFRVQLPCKDINECLVAGTPQAAIDDCIANAKGLDPEGLKRPSDFLEAVTRLFWPIEGDRPGYTLPYDKASSLLHFRPAELTLWTGAAGSGKSQLISDAIPHWIFEGARVCWASFEMKATQSLRRLVKQTGGIDRPTPFFIGDVLEYLDPGLLIYDYMGKTGVESLLEVFDYSRAKYNCDVFIIDSLMRLGIASDDYVGQEKLVYGLVSWAVENNVHVHLVAHSRKSEFSGLVPTAEDVKGASEVGANASNILGIWRNRKREEAIRNGEGDEVLEKPGIVLNVAKQRNGDFEGKLGLWFDQSSYRYRSSLDANVFGRRYIEPRDDSVGETAA